MKQTAADQATRLGQQHNHPEPTIEFLPLPTGAFQNSFERKAWTFVPIHRLIWYTLSVVRGLVLPICASTGPPPSRLLSPAIVLERTYGDAPVFLSFGEAGEKSCSPIVVMESFE